MSAKVTLSAAPEPTVPPPGAAGVSRSVGAPGLRPMDTSVVFGQIGSIDSVRAEIDDAFEDMQKFLNMEPDAVMRLCSGHSARLSAIRGLIERIEDMHRQWRAIRTREVEPAIAELANQYQIASRLLSARELDWKIETGGRSGP